MKTNSNVYNRFILNRLNNCVEADHYEYHHIFPKSIGGVDKSWNLIRLTVKDHHKAHFYRYQVYNEYIDKLALTLFNQDVNQKKVAQFLGSQSAVMLKKCGFQNPDV